MRQSTLDRIDTLKALMNTNNRTQIVAMCIAVTTEIMKRKAAGGKLFMEYPDKRLVELSLITG